MGPMLRLEAKGNVAGRAKVVMGTLILELVPVGIGVNWAMLFNTSAASIFWLSTEIFVNNILMIKVSQVI